MTEQRGNFNKIRKQIMKEHAIAYLICARCGHISASVHLHHITELSQGGNNHTSNLIPLCGTCHLEWDCYTGYMKLGEFLKTPNSHEWARLLNTNGDNPNMLDLNLCVNAIDLCRQVTRAVEYNEKTNNVEPWSFYNEVKRQNEIFNSVLYCDRFSMGR